MKKITILLLTILSLNLHAAHVRDDINALGSRSSELEQKLAGSKCYVEFLKSAEPNIRDYGNAEIQKTAGTNGGFLIIVTTEPKQWRISEWPLGVVAISVIEKAGDSMVLQFHQGNFFQAVLDAQAVLEPKTKADTGYISWLVVGSIATLCFISVCVILYRLSRVKPAAKRNPAEKNDESPGDNLTDAQKRKAERVFNRYSESERDEIARRYYGTPQYCSGCHNDSMLFYWLLFNNGGLNAGGNTVINNYNEPAPASEPARSYEPSSYSPAPSPRYESSDSGSSSSWDSGGSSSSSSFSSDSSGGSSSFDGGSSAASSSDSSGGGGSW